MIEARRGDQMAVIRGARSASTLLACLLLTACSSVEVATEVAGTLDMFGRQKSEQQSFLGISTAIFYPKGVPELVSKLPELGDVQLRAVQADLELQAKPLIDTLKARQGLMQTLMKHPVSVLTDQKFQVKSLDRPESLVNEHGVIVIDAKVVQGVFRGVALKAMDAPTELTVASNSKQQIALLNLIQSRNTFLAANPSPLIGSTIDVINSIQPGRSSTEIALEIFSNRLELAGAIIISEKASKSYDDALGFIIAHEMGHRALEHYSRLSAGESQRGLELEADKFGSLLLVLTRNRNVNPNNGFPVLLPGASMHSSFGGPWCFNEINHDPDGHEVFFNFGYDLAGFDSIGAIDPAKYPSSTERAVATEFYSKAAYRGIADAQDAAGSCEYDWKQRQEAAADVKKHLSTLYELRARRLRIAEEELKTTPNSEPYLFRQRILRPLVAGVEVHNAIYIDTAQRLK